MSLKKIIGDEKRIEALVYTRTTPRFYLKLFWAAAEGASRKKRLALLRAMGEIKPERGWTKPEKRHKEMRKHFSFARVDFDPEAPCFLCGGTWRHRHHILNIQNHGGNSKRNVVPLCVACHHEVHQRTF